MIIHKKHPKALGMTFDRVWAETTEAVEPAFVKAEAEGRAATMQDSTIFLERHGYLEEYVSFIRPAYYQYAFHSLFSICGCLNLLLYHLCIFQPRHYSIVRNVE